MIPALDVYAAGIDAGSDIHVGRCRFNLRRGRISCAFSYAEPYLARRDAYAIDPSLPLRAASYHCDGLPGALRDSAPDRWGRHLIERGRIFEEGDARRGIDEVDYLTAVHDAARQGNLRYFVPNSSAYSSSEGGVPPIVELKRIMHASNRLAAGAEGMGFAKELLEAGAGSLGGARPKASVLDEGKIYLAKFPHPGDSWDVMAWEKCALDIAACAGLRVPSARLYRVGDGCALVMERFDRSGSRYDGARIPYLSAMSLIGGVDGGQYDYLEVAEALAAWVSRPQRVLRDLFARIALSIALHNTDDHLRNIGLLREQGEWGLAPVFDVNIDPDVRRRRATSIYGEAGAGEAAALRELAGACGLDADGARSIVMGVVRAAGVLGQRARANECPQGEVRAMQDAVSRECAALRAAFGF